MNKKLTRRLRTVGSLLLLSVLGCTNTSTIGFEEGQANNVRALKELNKRAAKYPTTITLVGGNQFRVDALNVTPDSTSWLDPNSRAVESVATSQVVDVRFKNHGQGTLEGLGLGILGGAATGAFLGFVDGDDPPCERGAFICFRSTAQDKAAILAFLGAPIGGFIGMLSGAARGKTYVYQLVTRHADNAGRANRFTGSIPPLTGFPLAGTR